MKNKLIEIKNLTKHFKNKNNELKVIDNISFDIYEGEILSIVGTSGCGKTTLLNLLSNLDKDKKGTIKYNFETDQIGYMFQDASLFPWLTIEQNALMACKIKKIYNKDYIMELLEKYGLYNFKDKHPNILSGGMKQRVSLIRILSTKPKILFLDEPFAALDYQSRLLISNDVYQLVKEKNITLVLITHDISEAISMSDRVIVLSKRPSKIKNEYKIYLKNQSNPISNRKDELFMKYYNLISKELEIFDT